MVAVRAKPRGGVIVEELGRFSRTYRGSGNEPGDSIGAATATLPTKLETSGGPLEHEGRTRVPHHTQRPVEHRLDESIEAALNHFAPPAVFRALLPAIAAIRRGDSPAAENTYTTAVRKRGQTADGSARSVENCAATIVQAPNGRYEVWALSFYKRTQDTPRNTRGFIDSRACVALRIIDPGTLESSVLVCSPRFSATEMAEIINNPAVDGGSSPISGRNILALLFASPTIRS